MNGDLQGDFTYYGGRGSSVIDLCICSHSFLQYIDFTIACKPYFDHMPIHLNLVLPSCNYSFTSHTGYSQRLQWYDKTALKYAENIQNLQS